MPSEAETLLGLLMPFLLGFIVCVQCFGGLGPPKKQDRQAILSESAGVLLKAGSSRLCADLLNLIPSGERGWEWFYLQAEVSRLQAWRDPSWVGLAALPWDRGVLAFDSFGRVSVYEDSIEQWHPKIQMFPVSVDWARIDVNAEIAILAAGIHAKIVSISRGELKVVAELLRPDRVYDAAFFPKARKIFILSKINNVVEVLQYGYKGDLQTRVEGLEEGSVLNVCGDERFLIISSHLSTKVLDLVGGNKPLRFENTLLLVPLSDFSSKVLQVKKNTGKIFLFDLLNPDRMIWSSKEDYPYAEKLDVVFEENVVYCQSNIMGSVFVDEISLIDGSTVRYLEPLSEERGHANLKIIDTMWAWVWQANRMGRSLQFVDALAGRLNGSAKIESYRKIQWDVGAHCSNLWFYGPKDGIRLFTSLGRDLVEPLMPVAMKGQPSIEARNRGRLNSNHYKVLAIDFLGTSVLVAEGDSIGLVDVASGDLLQSMSIPQGNKILGCIIEEQNISSNAFIIVDQSAFFVNWEDKSLDPVLDWSRKCEQIVNMAISGDVLAVVGEFGVDLVNIIRAKSTNILTGKDYVVIETAADHGGFAMGTKTGKVEIVNYAGTALGAWQAPNKKSIHALIYESGSSSWIVSAGRSVYRWKNLHWALLSQDASRKAVALAVLRNGSRIALFWEADSTEPGVDSQLKLMDSQGGVRLTLPLGTRRFARPTLRFMNGAGDLIQVSLGEALNKWRIQQTMR